MKKVQKKLGIAIAIIAIIAALSVVFVAIYFITHKQDKGNAVIELSTSYDKVYLGGSGEINAILRYSGDGSIEYCDFAYESDSPDLFVFEQKEGKYTGKYAIEPKRNNDSFSDVSVKVTVSCVDNPYIEPSSIQIVVTDAKPLSIKFHRNLEDVNPTSIDIYQGYSIERINDMRQDSLEIPNFNPSVDYDTEWYDIETGELIPITAQSEFYGCSELKLYARCRLNQPIMLVDELNNVNEVLDNELLDSDMQVYYGEGVNEKILLKLRGSKESVDGWSFDGWVPDINDSDSEESFKSNLAEGKFVSPSCKLYAKWTSEINFYAGTTVSENASIGVPTFTRLNVTYNGNLPELPKLNYSYDDPSVRFDGWYTQPSGEGVLLQSGEKWKGSANQNVFAKTLIDVYFNDALNKAPITPRAVTYGKSFTESNQSVPTLIRDGWKFIGWSVDGLGEATNEVFANNKYTHVRPITVNALWELKIYYNADVGQIRDVLANKYDVVRFGSSLSLLTVVDQGSWHLQGWYINSNLDGQSLGDNTNIVATGSEDFIALVDEYKTIIDQNYCLPLYAKWTAVAALNYGGYISSNNLPDTVSMVYGQSLGAELPSNLSPAPQGYLAGKGWYNGDDILITQDLTNFPLAVNVLYYKWVGDSSTINFKYYNKSNNLINVGRKNATVDEEMPILDDSFLPTTDPAYVPDGDFLGYFYFKDPSDIGTPEKGTQYYDKDLNGLIKWGEPQKEVDLYAQWGTYYIVTLDTNGGSGGTSQISATYMQPMKTVLAGGVAVKAPTRRGYEFIGFTENKNGTGIKYYTANMASNNVWNKPNGGTIYAQWKALSYTVQYNLDGGNALTSSSKSVTFDSTYGALPTPTKNDQAGTGGYTTFTFSHWVLIDESGNETNNTINSGTIVKEARNHSIKAKWTESWVDTPTNNGNNSNPCVITGTLITLADGSQVPVEQLTGNEMLLVWNLDTGCFDAEPVFFLAHAEENIVPERIQVIELTFSDGTHLSIAGQHGLWNYTLNRYVFIRAENAIGFVGDWFSKLSIDGNGKNQTERVQLVGVNVRMQMTNVWSPITVNHLCYYANGMLVLPGLTEVFVNIFEVDEATMKYDVDAMRNDIEQYGLFTYEEFATYLPIPESYFNVFGAKYLKVAFGKGLLTWDDVIRLVKENKDFIYWDI